MPKAKPKRGSGPVILEQFVEVTRRAGQTITELYPPNKEMLELKTKMDPPPTVVYRRFNFRGGVPPEYHWATSDAQNRRYGGGALQRMFIEDWEKAFPAEEDAPGGHLGPVHALIPRPQASGGCDCPVCERATRYWQARGVAVP